MGLVRSPKKMVFSLTKQKQRRKLTPFGFIVVFFNAILLLCISVFTIHPFLSVTAPLQSHIMVLDGLLPDFALDSAVEMFSNQNYKLLLTTGGALPTGSYLSNYKISAEAMENTLKKMGFDSLQIVSVPGINSLQNRTYSSAQALKKWLVISTTTIRKINLISMGCHARRSRLLFQKGLGDDFEVGIIAIPDQSYKPDKWWQSSRGVRVVMSETIAYLYVRLFFQP